MPPISIKEKPDVRRNVDRATRLFDEYGEFVRSVIDFYVRDKILCDDIFQDLFLIFVSKPIPQDARNIKGFLYKVITDTIKDAFRRIDRYQARIDRYAEDRRCISEVCPEDGLIEIEETEKMFSLIERRLPKYEALAVTLRYRDNCDTGDVAEKMGVKPRSVSRYVCVGLKKIRQLFTANKGSNYDSR